MGFHSSFRGSRPAPISGGGTVYLNAPDYSNPLSSLPGFAAESLTVGVAAPISFGDVYGGAVDYDYTIYENDGISLTSSIVASGTHVTAASFTPANGKRTLSLLVLARNPLGTSTVQVYGVPVNP